MQKGVFSIDLAIAIILLSFIVSSLHAYEYNTLMNVDAFGLRSQSSAAAIAAGTQVNAFYTLEPTRTSGSLPITKPSYTSYNQTLGFDMEITGNTLTVEKGAVSASYPVAGAFVYFEGRVRAK